MTIAEDDSPSREWVLYHDAGRVLASALARLINAYEMSPERAQHALSWEHLPGRAGSRYPISERDEASARKYSDSAKRIIETSMLHEGRDPLSEYSQLLDDWDLIHGKADEESFKLNEYLDNKDYDWHVTGKGLTETEKRRLQGWSTEDVERLRSRDPELLNEYRREIEKEAMKEAAKGKDYIEWEENRRIWVEARLADLESAANAKMLAARVNDLDVQRSRWEAIERMRPQAENQGRNLLNEDLAESFDSEGLTLPERPENVERHFPDCMTPEMRIIYDATEKKQSQLWATSLSREIVDDYEELVGRLVASSREMPTTQAIARYMRWNEEKRTSEHRLTPRLPIPIDYGWHEYYSLVLDDEANLDREISEDVRKSGNVWIHWAKELVGMLPAVTKRAVELGKHPISDIPQDRVPLAYRTLFEQAHLLYIFDFDIPCILTCGTLVEEVVRKEFPDLNEQWSKKQSLERKSVSWKVKISDVVSQYPNFQGAKRHLLDIWYVRNDAAHDPAKYLTTGKNYSEEILQKTRKVLEILFEAAKSRAEGN